MKKFSKILEGLKSKNLSWNEKRSIRELIDNILLKQLGYDTVYISGLGDFIKPQSWEDSKKMKSILNYANTNMLLLDHLSQYFSLNSYQELYKFIEDNKEDLFLLNGKYFNMVIEKIKYTINSGILNEEYAKNFMEENWKDRGCLVRRTETDYYDDLILGIDLYFTVDGGSREYTVQVKPLKSIKKSIANRLSPTRIFKVESAGVVKLYNVDYYIFVNRHQKEVIMFKAKGASVYKNTFSFNSSNYVAYKG
jgi:hypothetical protein